MATTKRAPTNMGGLGNGMAKKRHPEPMIKQRTRPKIDLLMSNPGRGNRSAHCNGRWRLGFQHHVIGGQVAEGHKKDQKRTNDLRGTRSGDVKPAAARANRQTKQ
jgi:hypothetical protein